jgi:uncharacterized small protein (DUF1192 family)
MALFEEEERRPAGRPGPQAFVPANFDGWSLGDLEAYLGRLRAEIARTEAAMGSAEARRLAAEAFFRKG